MKISWSPSWRQMWIAPGEVFRHLAVLLPVAASMILQRLFHIVDNRFLSEIGSEALLLHNVQYSFVVFGQFLGMATATSALVFWKRPELAGARKSLLLKHVGLSAVTAGCAVGVGFIGLPSLLGHFGILPSRWNTAQIYAAIGLANMFLQALYTSLDGFLIAAGRQQVALALAAIQLAINVVADAAAVAVFRSTDSMLTGLSVVGVSSSLLLAASGLYAFSVLRRQIGRETGSVAWIQIFPVWRAELGVYLIRGTAPLLILWQFAEVRASEGFLVTSNLALHLAYLACLPLAAGCQIAVRDLSAGAGANRGPSSWWLLVAYTALIPTTFFLAAGIFFGPDLLQTFYLYVLPEDHRIYLPFFFTACWIGQIGNLLAVPLRALKKNGYVTLHFAVAEYGVLVGGLYLMNRARIATPVTVGILQIFFALAFLGLNASKLRELRS